MHFWIDKHSQGYGFGRARVAASLSGAGGNGLGFPHHARRIGGKSSSTSHRFPNHQPQQQQHSHSHAHHQHTHQQQQPQSITMDFYRSHNNNNNNTNYNAHNHSHSNNNNSNSNYNLSSNNSLPSNNNLASNSTSSSVASVHRMGRTSRNNSSNSIQLNNNNNHQESAAMASSTSRNYHHHPQFGSMSIRHYQNQATNIGDHNSHNTTRVQHLHQYNPPQRTQASQTLNALSASLPPIYMNTSQGQHFAETAIDTGPMSGSRVHSTTTTTPTANQVLGSTDSQILPSHLKYGLWATVVLASAFIVGAKFFADHQGNGLEVLIFVAFTATFFLAAWTVSLCRLPNSLMVSSPINIDETNRELLNQHTTNQLTVHQLPQVQASQLQPTTIQPMAQSVVQPHEETLELTPTGAPPPYHIAILLPESDKEEQFKDESPPPSYDKIVI